MRPQLCPGETQPPLTPTAQSPSLHHTCASHCPHHSPQPCIPHLVNKSPPAAWPSSAPPCTTRVGDTCPQGERPRSHPCSPLAPASLKASESFLPRPVGHQGCGSMTSCSGPGQGRLSWALTLLRWDSGLRMCSHTQNPGCPGGCWKQAATPSNTQDDPCSKGGCRPKGQQ